MKIKAKLYGIEEITIIDFISANTHDVKAVYIDYKGRVASCDIEDITILDKDYIPVGY